MRTMLPESLAHSSACLGPQSSYHQILDGQWIIWAGPAPSYWLICVARCCEHVPPFPCDFLVLHPPATFTANVRANLAVLRKKILQEANLHVSMSDQTGYSSIPAYQGPTRDGHSQSESHRIKCQQPRQLVTTGTGKISGNAIWL